MRRLHLVLVGCCIAMAGALIADEPVPPKTLARLLDTKGIKHPGQGARIDQPTVVVRAEELAHISADKEVQERLKKEIDFTKEKLVLFAWAGSGQDKLTPGETKADKDVEIRFQYQQGRTRDYRQHLALYAIPTQVKWSIAKGQ